MRGDTSWAALELASVSHRYGRRIALQDVSLQVKQGSFSVLLGLNGAGKTTLFLLVARLLALQAGEIRVFGAPIGHDSPGALARLGFVFQEPSLDLDLTVGESLRYSAALHGLSREAARARIQAELDRVGLAERVGEPVRMLSAGQRRRVEIARSLLHHPRLLLLDEATAGLDVASRKAVLGRARALCRDGECAVLWATHLLDEVDDGDEVLVLHKGRLVERGRPAHICRAASRPNLRESFARLAGLEEDWT